MRLASYRRDGRWVAAVADEDGPLVAAGGATVRELLAAGPDAIRAAAGAGAPIGDVALGPPVPDPDKILCVGLNYRPHAAEAKLDEPEAPLIFAKFANCLVGDGAPIVLPPAAPEQCDFEGEIAFVIGRRVTRASAQEALDALVGWMPFNDVTARDVQTRTSQWTVGKAVDGFGPCGPCLVLDDGWKTGGLELETHVNGERVQRGHTDEMIFSPTELVRQLSQTMTLEPGDLIVSGTPEGVGAHRDPPVFLAPGDVVSVRVADQTLTNPVRAASAATP